ncbi:MAG: hypothetical protein IKA97_06135 [Clostridia bacterium]|nr:hypothetical protein [Clostridia bacterium]
MYKAIKNAIDDIVCATKKGIPEIKDGKNKENLKITFKIGVSNQNKMEKAKESKTKGKISVVFLEKR